MAKTELNREEFEEAIGGLKISDWQWELIKTLGKGSKEFQLIPLQNGGRYGFLEGGNT